MVDSDICGSANADGIVFGPTSTGKGYISLFYHRRTGARHDKKCWHQTVPPIAEFGIFSIADARRWTDEDGHYWGVRPQAEILGGDGQRIAKFPRPTNAADRWHGYPVCPAEDIDDAPPKDLVLRWIDHKVVSDTVGKRILRFKI